MRFLIYLFWVLPPVALSFLAVMMSRRKLNTRYPFFCSYVAFQILDFAAQFAVYHVWPQQYYYEYFAGSILSICLSFAVIYELFTQVFEPFDGLRDLGGILFRWAALVLIVAATLMAITSSGMPHVNLKTALILSFERSVRVMQCGIVLLMVLCAPCVGLNPRHRIFGIASGFGIMASLDLISAAVVGRIGVSQTINSWFSLVHMAAFCTAIGIWTTYMLRTEPARGPVLQYAPSERWNFALSTAMHPEAAAPSLPLIMGAVDRTFDKLQSHRISGPNHADQ